MVTELVIMKNNRMPANSIPSRLSCGPASTCERWLRVQITAARISTNNTVNVMNAM
jgi:hypothetical protein